MEAAKIEWGKIESVFEVDKVYEDINAPQWVDLLSPPSPSSPHHRPDDIAWFCRPDCKHPTTAEDFLNSTPSSKLLRSVSVSKLIGLVDWTRREPNLKRRAAAAHNQDSENQDPNLSTPNHQINSDYSQYSDVSLSSADSKNRPKLKSTQSTKDLFGIGGGKDLLAKFTEFCNDWKKKVPIRPDQPSVATDDDAVAAAAMPENQPEEPANQRLPLLELPTKHSPKPKPKNKIKRAADDAENIPVSVDLNIMMKPKQGDKFLPVRTNPPTPQGFSANRDRPNLLATPPKPTKSRLMDRQVLEQVKQPKTLREELGERSQTPKSASPPSARQGTALDVFWFLKPCTLSS